MNFTFNDEHYLQILGTGMGTALVSSYANLFMDKFEVDAPDNWEKKPLIWLRLSVLRGYLYDMTPWGRITEQIHRLPQQHL